MARIGRTDVAIVAYQGQYLAERQVAATCRWWSFSILACICPLTTTPWRACSSISVSSRC